MRCAYHTDYFLPLPSGHPFPMAKYPLLCARLLRDGVLAPGDLIGRPRQPSTAWAWCTRTSTWTCSPQVRSTPRRSASSACPGPPRSGGGRGSRSRARSRPRARRSTTGWPATSRAARTTRFRHTAKGSACSTTWRLRSACCNARAGLIARWSSISTCTRAMEPRRSSQGDPDVFTFSVHGERNYPTRKMRSTLDVGLADGVGDDEYLERLERNLAGILAAFPADLVFYLAGVDIVQGDRYGRLALSDAGLRRRERHRARKLPPGRPAGRDHDRRRLRHHAGTDRRTARDRVRGGPCAVRLNCRPTARRSAESTVADPARCQRHAGLRSLPRPVVGAIMDRGGVIEYPPEPAAPLSLQGVTDL